jgi:hypothetical protein
VNRLLTRVGIAVAAGIVGIIIVATAVVFLAAALYLWLISLALSRALAALLVGVAGLLLVAIIGLIAKLVAGRPRRTAPPPTPASAATAATDVGYMIAREAVSLAHAHPYRSLVVAAAVGFVAGISPELRQLLTQPFKK